MSKEAVAPGKAACRQQGIAEARAGSRAALDRLYGACYPYLLVVAKQEFGTVLQARMDPADVVQETLIEAWRDFASFQGKSETDLLAWLRQILLNNLANQCRRHIRTAMRSIKCEVRLTEAAFNQLPDRSHGQADSLRGLAQGGEQTETLEHALRQLPDHYRQALLLHTEEELTFFQVGERLNCSAEAVRKLWKRAAKELAVVLEDA